MSGTVLRVSFDGCGRFAQWDPTTLPPGMIAPAEKPDYRKPEGLGDCRYHDFQDGSEPQYSAMESEGAGMLAFTVEAKAFREGVRLKVTTRDFGKTWSQQTP